LSTYWRDFTPTLYHTRLLFTVPFEKEQTSKTKLQMKYKRSFSYMDVRTRDIWQWNCSRRVVASLSRLRSVRVVDKMALGEVLSGSFGFPLSVPFHQCSIFYSAITNVTKPLQLTASLNNTIRQEGVYFRSTVHCWSALRLNGVKNRRGKDSCPAIFQRSNFFSSCNYTLLLKHRRYEKYVDLVRSKKPFRAGLKTHFAVASI
jgi:hypothetical protein